MKYKTFKRRVVNCQITVYLTLWSLATGYWSLATGHWSLVIGGLVQRFKIWFLVESGCWTLDSCFHALE